MNIAEGEWYVTYHKVARNEEKSDKVSEITGNIYKSGFKSSTGGKITNVPDLRHLWEKMWFRSICYS